MHSSTTLQLCARWRKSVKGGAPAGKAWCQGFSPGRVCLFAPEGANQSLEALLEEHCYVQPDDAQAQAIYIQKI